MSSNQFITKSDSQLVNFLLTSQYKNLVLKKIIKELFPDVEHKEEEKDVTEIILAHCKGYLGIHLCENIKNLKLNTNDTIIIKIDNEYDFATILEIGKIVNFRRNKKSIADKIVSSVERISTEKDNEKNVQNIIDATNAKELFKKLVKELSLEMKLIDIHYQFDRKKMFFFYTADGRVDFRKLAKKLAAHYKTRIELRQIGVRDEAKRLGGIATCGREYCCATFINNFKKITTDIAERNNISLNISKYTGPCGKLKCCLYFEVDN
ncbi:MAG: hypothetical protein CR986_05780 [Ignavibacteriae bacterium]|nr:MAG: hypothetical protein CR986_05780 [Ignavibacteriota bacterium]